MAQNYPNIVPENNLRLPDALTIRHGPARLLSSFILEADKATRRRGLRLRVRHDFDHLVRLNADHVEAGRWFRLINTFNPRFSDLSPENSYWVSAENARGEIVATHAGRVFYWPDTNLGAQFQSMFYGSETKWKCCVTAPAAKLISGVVLISGAVWVHPDCRGNQFSYLFTRIGKAYACARWPLDWAVAWHTKAMVERGFSLSAGGHTHLSDGVSFLDSPWGTRDWVIAYSTAEDIYEDLSDFMRREFATGDDISDENSSPSFIDDMVTNISSEGVFQGSSSRS